MNFTLADFLAKYRELLCAQGHAWTTDTAKVNIFMLKVETTINCDDRRLANHWSPRDSPLGKEAWVALGGKRSQFSFKSLRALPRGD